MAAASETTAVLYIRIPVAVHHRLNETAAKNRRSMAREAQVAIEKHVAAEAKA